MFVLLYHILHICVYFFSIAPDEIGVKKAALQLGLQYYTLADWRKARKYAKKHTVVLTENEANAKICKLERENAELRQANEILKDALGFFAKDRKM